MGASTEVLAILASRDMPISPDTGRPVQVHSHSWSFLINQSSDKCSKAVALLLDPPTIDNPGCYNYGPHAAALATVRNYHDSKRALQTAKSGTRLAVYKYVLLHGGFDEVRIILTVVSALYLSACYQHSRAPSLCAVN